MTNTTLTTLMGLSVLGTMLFMYIGGRARLEKVFFGLAALCLGAAVVLAYHAERRPHESWLPWMIWISIAILVVEYFLIAEEDIVPENRRVGYQTRRTNRCRWWHRLWQR